MKKLNVLIVEDSKPILQIHKHLVTKAGFNPVTAETFAEVKALEHMFPDLFCAIIDYSLPDAPNGEAIPYLLDHNVPGVVMTGMIDDKTRDTILNFPVIDYITKESKQAYTYLQHLLVKLRVNHLIKVLVVDDSVSAREYIKHLLKRHNYDVYVASSGEEAMKQLELHPDLKLIITDKEMPNMDGIELCNKIRSKYSKDEMSIIGISGQGNQSLTAKFIKNGANDFLTKPFCLEEFYCKVLQNIEFIESLDTIRKQANTDYLTGLYNRRYFFEQVSPEIVKRFDGSTNSTLAMMDIDHFKSVNDTYGHDAGDEILKATALLIQQHFSADYLAARIGGEEFCIFLDTLGRDEATLLMDNFRQEMENMSVEVGGNTIKCTISIGITHCCEKSFDGIMIKADELLYEAKESGRNIVITD
ncbi:diguanylate cyclase [Psychrosphaera aquimarina]|uniref:diguanylate cyclase n=1 Tax=Psychrosphaera aquimarina TaxID=2044854 RepID=A0ABU3R2C2_9GAMM|nr:diguanylate cyclase [Psychrosphaera aquimarina]MDU0113820.1 diguanylate cyclase [Psychrosphaera aquimarina]